MTRKEDPQRLPQEVELQAKREELVSRLTLFEQHMHSEDPDNYYPPIYLVDRKEVFNLSYGHCKVEIEPGVNTVRHEIKVKPIGVQDAVRIMHDNGDVAYTEIGYYPPMSFVILNENLEHEFFDMDGKQLSTVDDFESMTRIVGDMIEISRKTSSTKKQPVDNFSEVLKNLINKVREAQRMRYEYIKPEFYKLLRRVGSKAAKTDYSKYDPEGDNIAATTGWVEVERDGQRFELKFDNVGQINNGGYSELDEVSKRELGEKGRGHYLFGETGLWFMGSINNLEKLQECIDILKLLDEALPDPTPASS